ncbi:MAG: restriction endonuclease subunit S [Tissierellaceae bacterium]
MVAPALSKQQVTNASYIDLPDEEIKWSTVSLSEVIERQYRLEASVFDIEGKHAHEVLKNNKWETVNLLADNGLVKDAFYPGRFKRIYIEKDNGIPFFLPSQIVEINPKATKYISEKTAFDIDSLKLTKNTMLLTRSGTIGNCTIVTDTLEGKMFSDDIIRLSFKNEYDLGYVYAFFKTKIGNTVLQTNNYGSVVSHIEPEHLQNVPIPNPPPIIKQEVHSLIMESFKLRDESNKLLDTAEQLLIKELNLPPIDEIEVGNFEKNAEVNNFSVKLSSLDYRLEGSYHLPIVNGILTHFKKNAREVLKIGDSRISKEIILPGRFKRVYVEEGQGTVFFGGKQLFELDPSGKKILSTKMHKSRISNELLLRENMILITRSGTIGKVVLTPKHWEKWVINEHVIRVIPSDTNLAGFLSVFLSSDYGYELIKRFTYGSVVDEIDDNHVSQIEVPLLKNEEIQKNINNLALEANKNRYEAYSLEQKAIKMVNEDIIHAVK